MRPLWVLALLSALTSAASAQSKFAPLPRRSLAPPPQIPDLRISIVSLLVGRVNPLGLEEQLRIGPQKLLYRSDSMLFRDNFLFVGASPKVNPAFVKLGPSIEIQPLSIFNLRVSAELVQWFGTFGFMQSYQSPLDNYSDTEINAGKAQNRMYQATGGHFTIEPLIQVKAGPIAIRNRFSIEYWNMSVRSGDKLFYDPTLDTLVPANGWVIANDLDLLYLSKFKLVIGARYSVVLPLYQASDYLPGETQVHSNGHQRLGPLLAYTFFDRGYSRFNKPTLILIANWYLSHRFRTGQDVNQGVPYVVLGFAFTSDIILK
jgi:hypothetical protein